MLISSALGGLWWYGTKENGTYVKVTVEDRLYGIYDLNADGVYEITGICGTNTLVIKDHTAYFSEADCPDVLCVKSGKKRKTGESIVCLPHKVVAEITKEGEDAAFDAVSR